MASRTRLGFYASLLVITGCFSAGGGSCVDVNGLAGNGNFDYECVGDSVDPECDNLQIELGGHLPTRAIARTASFRLTFPSDTTKSVKTASANAVSGSGTFTVHRAGLVGFFVEALGGTDDIEDAIRLEVANPDSVRISRIGTLGFGERFDVGATQRFRVNAFENKDPLVGALSATWEVEPQDIVELEPERFGACKLHALAAGKVQLTVRSAGFTDTLAVDIVDGPIVRDDAGDADASTDASGDGSGDGTADGGSTDASQD